jgi:hypothetical protein
MARISVASAKAKGRALQCWAARKIAELLGVSWGYGDDCVIKPRNMGQIGTDVIIPESVQSQFPFSIECKSGEHWNIQSAMIQAKSNQKKNTEWMLILKNKSMKTPIIVLDANVFFKMTENIRDLQLRNK